MSEHDSHEHSSFIKTPKQLIAVIVLSFLVPVLVIAMLASLASRGVEQDPARYTDEAVAQRLKPVGEVVVTAAGGASAVRTGQQVTEAVCAACHATGALNAPKIGDAKAWAPLIKEGHAHLTETAIKGIRQMPPRGGNPDLSDVEVGRAVAYMANQSGAKFTEPAAPAAPAAPAQAAGAAPAPAPAAATVAAAPAGATASAPATGAAGGAAQGKSVYDSACVACHGAGVAGAPKTGDKAAWAPRMKQGMPALYEAAMKGKGAMPPKGGNMALSDADVKAAVDFLASQAK
jgi:cytochrome c5